MRTGKPASGTSGDVQVIVAVRVQPRASRTEVAGMHGDAVKIRLRAPPVDGAANDELIRFVAGRVGVRLRDVDIVGGAASRSKRVRVRTALPVAEVVRRLCEGGKSQDA